MRLAAICITMTAAMALAAGSPATKPTTGKGDDMKQVTWTIDNMQNIGGNALKVEGAPKVIQTPAGKAVEFDGKGDALVVDVDPLEGASTFTFEVIFRPDAEGAPEQRFFHIQESGSDNRVMMETRLPPGGQWYGDTYIRNGRADKALNSPKLTHPLGQWHSMALVYDGQQMIQYVDGVKELTGKVAFKPHGKGQTSIGMRINKVHFFKGAIRLARFTHGVLPEADLLHP